MCKVIALLLSFVAVAGCVSVSEEGLVTLADGEERVIRRDIVWTAGAKGDRAMQDLTADWETNQGRATISSLQTTEGVTTPNTLSSVVQLADLIAGMRVQLAETEAQLERERIESGATQEQTIERILENESLVEALRERLLSSY